MAGFSTGRPGFGAERVGPTEKAPWMRAVATISRRPSVMGVSSHAACGQEVKTRCQICRRRRDLHGVRSLPVFINRDVDYDWLIALEFGRVLDGQPADHFIPVDDDFVWILDGPGGAVVGFAVDELSSFDAEAVDDIWDATGPRFCASTLGLSEASAGEIVLAAQARYGERSTLNRDLFDEALATAGEEAAEAWRAVVESGDAMGHYGLGYTLIALDRHQQAYDHLRFYTELAPWNAWGWCWFGQACAALGMTSEARHAYQRAIALEASYGEETDARELLEELCPGRA